jgi:hypothetical protein
MLKMVHCTHYNSVEQFMRKRFFSACLIEGQPTNCMVHFNAFFNTHVPHVFFKYFSFHSFAKKFFSHFFSTYVIMLLSFVVVLHNEFVFLFFTSRNHKFIIMGLIDTFCVHFYFNLPFSLHFSRSHYSYCS